MRKFFVVTLLLLTSCSTIAELYTNIPDEVAKVQYSYATAEHVALIYAGLPSCAKTTLVLCRQPTITKQLKTADNAAFTAIEAAYKAKDQITLTAAQTAVAAFTAITDTLPTR